MEGSRWLDAVAWHSTISEVSEADLTAGEIHAWQQWYANPENQRVFEQLCDLLEDRRAYRNRDRPSPAALNADSYDPSLSVRDWRQGRGAAPSEPERRPIRRLWLKPVILTALAVAAALAGVLVLRPHWLRTGAPAATSVNYRTGLGELKTVQLADGSTVTLGALTRLSVDYTAHRRAVRLFYGEAWFRDKDIPNRPFTVTAGNRMITALGTAFVVNRDSDRVVVVVTSGIVEVSAVPTVPGMDAVRPLQPSSLSLPVIRLRRGELLSYGDKGSIGPVKKTSTRTATAWTHGVLAFDNVRLRDVIENVDRYWSRPILVSPRAGSLRFSGLIDEHEIPQWLNGLSTIFPVKVEQTKSSAYIRMRASQAAQTSLK
jgi:transmembrane sensor